MRRVPSTAREKAKKQEAENRKAKARIGSSTPNSKKSAEADRNIRQGGENQENGHRGPEGTPKGIGASAAETNAEDQEKQKHNIKANRFAQAEHKKTAQDLGWQY